MGSSWAGMTFRVIASWSEGNWPLQQSPTFLAPGTSFVEDNFSMDQGGGVVLRWFKHIRNVYASQEATVRTGHETTDWFLIGKGVRQGCILSPCLFNLYAEYIMRNAGLNKAKAGIKIARRNINNLRYADDTTLMAENEDHGIQSHHFMGNRWGNSGNSVRLFWGLQNHCRWWLQPWN